MQGSTRLLSSFVVIKVVILSIKTMSVTESLGAGRSYVTQTGVEIPFVPGSHTQFSSLLFKYWGYIHNTDLFLRQ